MQNGNFTLLNLKQDTKNRFSFSFGKGGKETEPLRMRKEKDLENFSESSIDNIEEKTEFQPPQELAENLEVVPEKPEIDEELVKQGVQTSQQTSIFVNSRKIELPLSLEKVDEGLHKPITSSWRWLAELTKYILSKFHLTIKKVNGVFKLVVRDE